ncbi:hypothetical protein FACS1894147_12870 [Spirochaetia bacterium]|nr:hypothetical protein FACS1894147_12870 [Spirochaetia bacterium]
MKGLEITSYDGKGYKPLVDFESWRVALINGASDYQAAHITSLSCHCETDEIFVLLKGSCLLLIGGNGDVPGEVEKVWLEEGLLYNVTKGTWHNECLMPGAKVLIVENANTSGANSRDYQLPEAITLG